MTERKLNTLSGAINIRQSSTLLFSTLLSILISFHTSIHAHISKTSCFNGVLSTGNGRGSQWMCRNGYCEPRSEFEMEMEQVIE